MNFFSSMHTAQLSHWPNISIEEMEFLRIDFCNDFDISDIKTYYHQEGEEEENPHTQRRRRKILHDCMWNGQCVDKDHEKHLPSTRLFRKHLHDYTDDDYSLHTSPIGLNNNKNYLPINNKKYIKPENTNIKQFSNKYSNNKNYGSDGENIFPETPERSESSSTQNSSNYDSDSDCDELVFKHDQICINEKLSECMGSRNLHVSEITGQQIVQKTPVFKQPVIEEDDEEEDDDDEDEEEDEEEEGVEMEVEDRNDDDDNVDDDDDDDEEEEEDDDSSSSSESETSEEEDMTTKREMMMNKNINASAVQNKNKMTIIRNSLNDDHCYYTHQPSAQKCAILGVQTPSDSEEEIDVVTCEKTSKPAVLPTYPSVAQQQVFQISVNSALKEKPAPRPRGRPPLQGNRKITVAQERKPAKRVKQSHPYSRKQKIQDNDSHKHNYNNNHNNIKVNMIDNMPKRIAVLPPVQRENIIKQTSDDEPETDKRNLHNNMERQRRIELRDAFDALRQLIPELSSKDKAPKVIILKQAAEFCRILAKENNRCVTEKMMLAKKQEKIKKRLSIMRKDLQPQWLDLQQS